MILKFQQGGIAIPPLVSYTPVMVTQGSTTSGEEVTTKGDNSGSKEDLTDKDILKMLEKLNALPNEADAIHQVLSDFYIDQQYSPFPNTSSIASRFLEALHMMQRANFNRARYDESYEKAVQNGSINEIAINARGQVVGVNEKGDYKLLRPEQLVKEGYKPITTQELLYLRAYNPDLVNKNEFLSIVDSSIGMSTVIDIIQKFVDKIGYSQETDKGYINKQSGALIKGLNDFKAAVQRAQQSGISYNGTTQDLYRYELMSKSQKDQADIAMTYIYNILPENAKSLLKTRTQNGTDEEAHKLIGTIIASQIDYTHSFDIELKGGKTINDERKAATKATDKDTTDLKTSLVQYVQAGEGGADKSVWMDIGNGIQMHVKGSWFQTMTDRNNEPIMDTNMLTMLTKSGLQDIIKNNGTITYGDQKITMEQLRNITYNNTGVVRANLPIKSDGSVDLEVLPEFQKAEAEIELLGPNPTQEQIKQIFHNHQLDELLDANGRPRQDKFGPFILAEGYTTEQNGIKDSNFVKNKTDEITDVDMELIKRSLSVGTGKDAQAPDIDEFYWLNPADWFGNYDNIYKATVFIPITMNRLAAVRGGRQTIDHDEADTLEKEYQTTDKRLREQNNSADLLGL